MVKKLTYFSVIFLGMLLLCAPVSARTPECKEACLEVASENQKALDDCLNNAKNIQDQLTSVRTRQNCRKRYPLLQCAELPSCKKAVTESSDTKLGATYALGTIHVSGSEKNPGKAAKEGEVFVFKAKQTVWLRCNVKATKKQPSSVWFTQDILIQDGHGNIAFQDTQSMERGGEMVSDYDFETHFSIPEDFQPGEYTLKFRVREKFSRWEEEKEIRLKISGS